MRAKVCCGIDWAEDHHDVALVDADGALVAKRRIDDSADGFAQLLTMLADAGDTATDPTAVAIETPRGLLVAGRRQTGRRGCSINPMARTRATPEGGGARCFRRGSAAGVVGRTCCEHHHDFGTGSRPTPSSAPVRAACRHD